MQRNISSYLPLFYISLVVFCISIIHVSEEINKRRHQEEIRAIDLANKQQKTKKKRKKPSPKVKKEAVKKVDTLSQTSETPKTKVNTKTTTRRISDEEFFLNLFEKEGTQAEQKSGARSRTDIVIRYYKKEKDGDRVFKLRDLGFYIHERPAENDFEEYASNAIFYGDSVKQKDLLLIAYQLMQNGIKLQSMTLSKYHDAWKAHSVEIGTDTTALKDIPFTLGTLRKKWQDM